MKIGSERMNRWARNLLGVFEVVCWIGLPVTFVISVAMIFGTMYSDDEIIEVCRLIFPRITDSPGVAMLLLLAFCIASCFTIFFAGKLWRTLRLVFDTSAGKTKASIGPTPFQAENVRLLNEAGKCILIIEAINIAFVVIRGILGDPMESFSGLVSCVIFLALGLCVFCLAHFFAYGIQLQLDSDGLV